MAIPPTLLLRKLVLESLLSSGPFTIFFPIARCLPLVLPPSSPPEPNMLSFHKSPWARFLMQFRPPNTSISSFSIQSAHRQLEMFSRKKHSFKAVTKKKKPLVSAMHRKKCLAFALTYKEWTMEDWKRVIWSDEMKINRIGSDGKQWVWKQVGEGLISREVQGTVKFGGGKIMVWGCMGWEGVGQLAEVEGRMDGDQYVAILEDHLVPSIEESGIFEEEAIFQQDNEPKHTSKKAKKWMEDHNISLLDWPPQSPDLNPIECLWKHIKSELTKYPTQPKGVWEIWERVAEVWDKIRPEVCQDLIESMPRRVQAVIKAKGGDTKY